MQHLESIWDLPDEGIWEVRNGRRQFIYSKVMAWVAFDRAIRAAEDDAAFDAGKSLERWHLLRDRIHADVCSKGFHALRGSFVQSYGSTEIDASLLLIPLTGFLPISDARVVGTIRAVEQDLLVDGLVMRYRTARANDGLRAGEGAFLPCSFWLVDVYSLQGRHHEARALFERLIGLCNNLGLLAEEYSPALARQLGNFPQAFSHLSLIASALHLGGPKNADECHEVTSFS